MKVILETTLEGKVVLPIGAEVETLTDLTKLAKKLQDFAGSVKKLLPDLAARKIEKIRITEE